MTIAQTLRELGLEGKRAEVYLAALHLGSASVQEIAKKAGFQRPTTSDILDDLVGRGLLSVVTEKRTRIFSADSPKKLLSIAEDRTKQIASILPDLEALFGKSKTKPRVRFYEGIEGIKTVYEDTLTVSDKKLRAILSAQDLFVIPGKKYMDDYVARRIDAGISLKVIRSETKEIEELWPASHQENRELHLAPSNMIFAMTMYLYDDKIALIGTQHEPFGLILQSADFFTMQSNLFETLWQVTRVVRANDRGSVEV